MSDAAKATSGPGQEAALELYARSMARNDLLEFSKYTMPGYTVSAHHKHIATRLQAAVMGKNNRVILTVPPRHGKSELASHRLPAWYLGRRPTHQVICATYNAEFASDFGREVRNIIEGEYFKNIFPNVRVAQDSRAVARWHTNLGGAYLAAGVGTGITGRGGHLIIIDDPLKGRDDADSKVFRDRLWNWYRAVLYTRQMPGANMILIQTRWHDDDLCGRLLNEAKADGEQWELINLPALADSADDALGREMGEALWPKWYDEKALNSMRRAMGPRDWSALYQQKPIEDEGVFFKREWIEDQTYNREELKHNVHYEAHRTLAAIGDEKYLNVYGASDYAVTDGRGDFTVHVVVGVDADDVIHVLDIWRGQTEAMEWIEALIDLILKWKPAKWAEEKGQILRSVGPLINKRLNERRAYTWREGFAATGDKSARARPFQARMAMGKVKWPKNASFMSDVVYEFTRFPAGVNDDIVDAFSLIGHMLDHMNSAPDFKRPPVNALTATTQGDLWERHRRGKKHGIRKREAPVIGKVIYDGTHPTLE